MHPKCNINLDLTVQILNLTYYLLILFKGQLKSHYFPTYPEWNITMLLVLASLAVVLKGYLRNSILHFHNTQGPGNRATMISQLKE